MKSFKNYMYEVYKGVYLSITVPYTLTKNPDLPNNKFPDVYLDKWDKKNGTITVQADDRDLFNWLTKDKAIGLDKKKAQDIIKKGKKEEVNTEEAVNPTSYVSREGKKILQKYKKEIKAANKAKSLAVAFDKLGQKAYDAIGNMLSNDGSIKTDDPDEWDKEIGDWVSFVKV